LLYYGFYIDITKEKEALIILEKQYQRAISYSDNVKIQGFISSMLVNLSENKVEEYSDTEKFKKIVQKGYSYDEVNLHNTSIFWADKKNYQQKCSLSSTSLINAFNTGRTTVEQEWQMCMDDGKINWVKTTVKLTKKPNTKDVFAFIYTQNIHKEKIANYIVNHAATKVSDMIMYIESSTGDFVCYKKGLKEPISSANYDEVIEDAIRREIQGFTGEDIEIIIKEMKISNIMRELENKEDYVFVTHFKDKNGKYQCKKMQFSYLDKALGSIIHVRTDVTELYEQEQEKKEVLTHALQAAEQANKAKSRFLSSMSHDIRTPIYAIIGMSQLAQYDLNDQKQVAESLAIIDNSSRHLLDLINDVLDMSKIESGGIKLQMEK
ncbi:MAG: histidine kinase dimerization/phospho-acceptor domain-containing protein, partial [Oscillospiraceae bacterium]